MTSPCLNIATGLFYGGPAVWTQRLTVAHVDWAGWTMTDRCPDLIWHP
jgi:hypothetical protein